MLSILVASISPFSGKNVVGVGLARKLASVGKQVGYFKPLGPLVVRDGGRVTDEDAVFFKRVLNLGEPLEALCPIILHDETISDVLRGDVGEIKEKILVASRAASDGKDAMIMMSMGGLDCGEALGYPMSEFVKDVGAKVVLVDTYNWPLQSLDGILCAKKLLGDQLAGVLFNNVPTSRLSIMRQAVEPFLSQHGVPILGILPSDTVLRAVPIADIVKAIDGKVLCCGESVDELVENVMIGAMSTEGALRFFRRKANKAVITGGDRPDMHLAALETSTRCLILTGDLYPNERILARAEELGVPVVLTPLDTSSAAEACEHTQEALTLHCERKITRIVELMDKHLDWDVVSQTLGIE
jgi:uncharacterized protein